MGDLGSVSNAVMWSGVVGFLMPVAVSVIVRRQWSSEVKAVAAFLCCVVASIGTAWFTGLLVPEDVARCFLVVFTLSVTSYYGFWKPTDIAPRIEAATSPR